MRDQSLSVRILVLAVLLPVVAAVCVAALVVTGALHPRIIQMVAVGGALLIFAVLAAAISAFTPKYRPTPLLTPLFAGIIAAALATTAIYTIRAYVTPRHNAVAAAETRPAKPAPAINKPSVAPARVVMPQAPAQQPAVQPSFDTATNAPPLKAQGQVQPDVQPLPGNAADRAAMGGPLVDVANAVVPPAQAAEKPVAAATQKQPDAMAKIPIPKAAPEQVAKTNPNPDGPIDLVAGFDPTGPTVPAADGPPIVLDTADAAPAHRAAIPPLPHIRPCGGAGQACP